MQTDDDSQTTLSKWPFILGDVLLVAAALAIAILGGWQLTDWQVGACVAAVALGAALFVLPYVVEFQVRVREEQEDRAADIRILEKHLFSAEQLLNDMSARTRALEAAVADMDSPNAALAEAVDKKMALFEGARASQEEMVRALKEDLNRTLDSIPAEFDPKILQPIEARIKALEERPELKVGALVKPAGAGKEAAPVTEPTEEKATPALPAKKAAQVERPQRATRERHRPEGSRLLKRAISEKGDHSSAAVSRIIESRAKEKSAKPIAQQVPKAVEAEKKESKAETSEPTSEAKAPESQAKAEKKVPQPVVEIPAGNSSDILLDDSKVTSPVTQTKAKKNDAVITASVFIGIGNKPYLRGSGAGLSWERGAVMEFQEIGKWRWLAPSDLDAPLELQIYRNDEDPDQSGKYTLEPGQKLEVTPVF